MAGRHGGARGATQRDLQAVRSRDGSGKRLAGSTDLRPYVEHLLAVFGPERLLWGSDWPVVNRAGGYDRWREATMELLAGLSDAQRQAILGGNAARVYLSKRGRP